RVDGSESARVEELLRTRFNSPFARFAVLVMTGAPAASTPAGDSLLSQVIARVDSIPGVTKTISYLDARESLFGRSSRGTFAIVGLDAATDRPDAIVPSLRAATSTLADSLRAGHPAI